MNNVNFLKKIIKCNKQEYITTIPTTHEVIHLSSLSHMRKKAQQYDKLISQITSKNYRGSEQGDAMLGFGASLIPSSGYAGLATALPFVIASIFENAGIKIDCMHLVNSLPNRDVIRKCVTENAIDTIYLLKKVLSVAFMFIYPVIGEIRREIKI